MMMAPAVWVAQEKGEHVAALGPDVGVGVDYEQRVLSTEGLYSMSMSWDDGSDKGQGDMEGVDAVHSI